MKRHDGRGPESNILFSLSYRTSSVAASCCVASTYAARRKHMLVRTSQTLPTASRTCVFRRWLSRSSSLSLTPAAATSATLASGAGASWKGRSAGSLCFRNKVSFEGFRPALRFPSDVAVSLSREGRRQGHHGNSRDRGAINGMHGADDRRVIDVLVRLQSPDHLLCRGKLGCALVPITLLEVQALMRVVRFLPLVVRLKEVRPEALGCRVAAY